MVTGDLGVHHNIVKIATNIFAMTGHAFKYEAIYFRDSARWCVIQSSAKFNPVNIVVKRVI